MLLELIRIVDCRVAVGRIPNSHCKVEWRPVFSAVHDVVRGIPESLVKGGVVACRDASQMLLSRDLILAYDLAQQRVNGSVSSLQSAVS
jgi:hypothetical protein